MIKQISAKQKDIIDKLIKIEFEVFGEGGLNEWTLLPIIRHGKVFYIEENNQIIGSAQFMLDWKDHTRTYLIGVSIAKEFHGKGYGTSLLKESINSLFAEGIKVIELTVDPENKPAIAIYERKLGFAVREIRNDEYGKGIHRLLMEKYL
jgi:ribosomal-protein-alanine N-acetyltransferase